MATDRPRVSRRTFLAAAAAAGFTTAAPRVAEAAPASRPTGGFVAAFAAPPRSVQAKFRWWWPHGLVDPGEIAREIDQIADAGFGGVEIADVHHSIREPLDPAGHGWGTPPWVRAVESALTRAKERGVVVDLTIGPAWPAALPTITPQSDAAMKELAHGMAVVESGGGFAGSLPAPAVVPSDGVTARALYVAQVARLADGTRLYEPRYSLDRVSVQDVTASVVDERLEWRAPDDGGTWLVVAYWLRGSGQRPERGPHNEPLSYVIDHFSRIGTQAVIDFWEQSILTTRMRSLLRDTGGTMFEDSIEMETDATLWTPELPAEFERRKDYSLLPYLPVLIEQDEDPVFSYDSTTDRQVRDDLNDVRSDLYIEHHLRPLQEWLHNIGLGLRVQPYGLETDAMAKAAVVDIAEGESLGFDNLDDFRSLAGGRDMAGKTVLSSEAAAVFGASYSMTWERAVRTVSREYAAGVNQAVLHGFSYADAPGAQWPGFAAFTPYDGGVGYSESWGPRSPHWRHAPDVAGFFARAQHVLRAGVARCDVAFLRQKGYAGTGFGAAWFSSIGVREGWTHQFLSPRLLELPSAIVKHGRLAPKGPGYQVLVFEGDAFNRRVNTMPLPTARRLLEYARAGLRIIVVGTWTDPRVPGIPQRGENAALAAVFQQLLAEPTVHRVDDRPLIPDAVEALGLRPEVRYAESSPLLHVRRRDEEADYVYLANSSDSAVVDHDVTISTEWTTPYRLEPWTGDLRRIPVFQSGPGWVRIRVRLRPGAASILALAAPDWLGAPGTARQVVETDADEIRDVGGQLMLRAGRSGDYTSRYAHGHSVHSRVGRVGDEIALGAWELTVEDWQPGDSATDTDVERHHLSPSSLAAWRDLPGLGDVSGIGHYSTTVELDEPWTGGYGAYLHLGEVSDTFRVTVNGHRLPPANQLDPVIDVGPYMHAGLNTIEVEVASTLINRLRVSRPDVYGGVSRQAYGLMGPTRLVPYGEVRLR